MFKTYCGVTLAEHQACIDILSAEGYRLISISVYGEPDDARYAAVWVQREGPAWVTVNGVNSDDYQSFFNQWTAKGYAPVLISATGAAANAIFSAVFEHGVALEWLTQSGMTAGPTTLTGSFANINERARQGRMILRSVALYGERGDLRYAAIWQQNIDFVKWHVYRADTADSYQTVFNAQTQLPGTLVHAWRPAFVSMSGAQIYCSVFKDDSVGHWVARHGMSASDYAQELELQTARGFYPIDLHGAGSGPDTRYAAVFAGQDQPFVREWTVSGAENPSLAGLDRLMKAFMRANGVRAAQLAVGRQGAIRFSRGYTWAEAGYRLTEPSDRFLLASCSKMFLEAAVQALYDAGQLTPDTHVYPLLGFSGPKDPRSDDITIQQLLDHQGGYNDLPVSEGGSGFDPSYELREIALALGLTRPATRLDAARYMYQQMLQFTPGDQDHYSNFGYMLAGAVVEHVTGMAYFDYVKQALLDKDRIQEVEVFATVPNERGPQDAIAEDQAVGLSALDIESPLLVPAVYGGSGCINEVCEPNAGLGASAQALVQFIAVHAVWGNGPRTSGCARSGSTYGASTWASSRRDGLDWALTINTRNWPPCQGNTLHDLITGIDAVLDGAGLPHKPSIEGAIGD